MRFAGSASRRPSQPVGILANFDATHYFHRMLINDNNINVGRACQECTRTIRWHNDAGGALSDSDSLDGFPRGSIDNGEI